MLRFLLRVLLWLCFLSIFYYAVPLPKLGLGLRLNNYVSRYLHNRRFFCIFNLAGCKNLCVKEY